VHKKNNCFAAVPHDKLISGNAAVTTATRFRFDSGSTSQGLNDVTHHWPLTR